MGMFTQSRLAGLSEDFIVEANESYKGAAGAYRAMTESYQNNYAVFESCIGLDFMEAAVVNEAGSAEEFEIVQEGFAMDFFNKIKEFLKKLIEKIKGIITSFLTKLNGTFCRDNKALVNKYKSEVLKKQSQLNKMKYKWMPPTDKWNGKYANCSTPELQGALNAILVKITNIVTLGDGSKAYKDPNQKRDYMDFSDKNSALNAKDAIGDPEKVAEVKKIKEDLNDNTLLEKDLGALCGQTGGTELGEFAKELHDFYFDAEEEFEGFDDSDAPSISDIMLQLTTGKKTADDAKKLQREQEKETKEIIKEIERKQKEVSNLIPDKNDNRNINLSRINAILSIAMTAANQISTVQTKFVACWMDEHKKYLARCKKIFVKAAAYRPKANNESAILAEALGESAEYEVCEYFDNFVID